MQKWKIQYVVLNRINEVGKGVGEVQSTIMTNWWISALNKRCCNEFQTTLLANNGGEWRLQNSISFQAEGGLSNQLNPLNVQMKKLQAMMV